jgi:small-conductance mechanosensitive channel
MAKPDFFDPEEGDGKDIELEDGGDEISITGGDKKEKKAPKKSKEDDEEDEPEVAEEKAPKKKKKEEPEPEEEEVEEEPETEEEEEVEEPKEDVAKLKADLEEAIKIREKLAKDHEDATGLSRKQASQIAELQTQIANGSVGYLELQAKNEEHALAVAQNAFKAALASGDVEALTKAQSDVSLAANKAYQARSNADQLKGQLQNRIAEIQKSVELVATPAVSNTKASSWRQKNVWFNPSDTTDPKSATAVAFHNYLANAGVVVGSDYYFDQIDTHMKNKFPDFFGAKKKVSGVVPSKTAGSQQAKSVKSGTVRLTSSQIAYANKLGIPVKVYAAEVAALNKKGGK